MSEEVIKYPKVATGVLIFNEKQEILLVRSHKWPKRWIVPGGKLEFSEKLIDCARREIKEETNLDLDKLEYFSTSEAVVDQKNHFVFINYTAIAKNPSDLQLNEELLEYKWMPIDSDFSDLKLDSTKKLIEDYKNKQEENNWQEKYKRALADYQNLIKNTEKNKAEFVKYALEDTMLDLLGVYDHLKLSLKSLPAIEKKSAWVEGVSHVLRQFKELLENKGIKEIEVMGQKFDYQTMEAIEGKGDYVVKEVSTGYNLHDKLIKPAKVIVGDKNN
jgi:molecular chaperone GrpE